MDVESQIAQCEHCRDMLKALIRIHLDIDSPIRKIEADEPDWIFRLRKVLLHSMAINKWTIDIDSLHAMATEIRAAYVQIDAVWKCMPEKFRLEEMDSEWWASEARDGMLATYDHPTSASLSGLTWMGGFGGDEGQGVYIRLAFWLLQLGLGYGLALNYLAEVLGTGDDVTSRVAEAMNMVSVELGK